MITAIVSFLVGHFIEFIEVVAPRLCLAIRLLEVLDRIELNCEQLLQKALLLRHQLFEDLLELQLDTPDVLGAQDQHLRHCI